MDTAKHIQLTKMYLVFTLEIHGLIIFTQLNQA